MGGISGAFLLLPFQVSVLHFTSPAVSATNFVYNIVAIPSGVYRYMKEGRMAWPLAWIVIIGTLPGVLDRLLSAGALSCPTREAFKLFVGLVGSGHRRPPGDQLTPGVDAAKRMKAIEAILRGRGATHAVAT